MPKHTTPKELDFIFDRHIIEEEAYASFWQRWWRADDRQKENIVNEYLITEADESPFLPLRGSVTKSRESAEATATAIGGYVVRRDRNGRFSKRGKFYQAIKRGTRKSSSKTTTRKKKKRR